MINSHFSLLRVWRIFRLLHTLFLVIKRRERLILKPLSPKKLKDTITDLGASFIKLAQVLATRADFFSEDYLEELRDLHDSLPAMKEKDFQKVYNRAFKAYEFEFFDKKPIASASIGQVHKAVLKNKDVVAVKLRRNGIEKRVKADIKILNFFNKLFKPLFSYYTKNSIEAVIQEFSKMILEEVDLSIERENLKRFSSIYKDSGIVFPFSYDELSSCDALVLNYIEGFRFDEKEKLKSHNIDFRPLIKNLVDFYVEQMLINGYFHADPHPGNILVTKRGDLVFLDFGMVKKVPSQIRVAIIELLKAANEKDYDSYISASKKLGTIAYEAPESELAQFTERMFEIFGNESLDAQSMQKLVFDVLESTRDLPFKLPQEAIYILRVSAIIEGLGTTYIKNFNGVKDILPILQENIPRAIGNKDSIFEIIVDEIKEIPFLIKNFKHTINQMSNGELNVVINPSQLEWMVKESRTYAKGLVVGFLFVLGGILLAITGEKELAIGSFVFGSVLIVYKI
ncbi:MAG: AarF/UbiB family protein [Campylobacterales bacterium]|nr:AarF/UbiB family protein [Campylobacterales bacterium]